MQQVIGHDDYDGDKHKFIYFAHAIGSLSATINIQIVTISV